MNTAILNESIKICNFLGDSVNNRKTFEYVPDDFAVRFAEYNKLSTLLYSASKHYGTPEEELQKLAVSADRELLRQLRNDALQEKIVRAFEENGIVYAVLKGTETRRFYPEHLMRTSNDIDFYIDPNDIVAAVSVLKSMGLEYVTMDSHGEDFEFRQGGSYVELHISLGGITKRQKRLFGEMAARISGGLSREDQYICAVFHLYKHFITAGAGARMFLDVYCIGKADNTDRKYIETVLDKLDILRFENKITRINEVLFESKEASSDILEILEYIFENGAYGSETAAKHMKYAGARATERNSAKSVIGDLCFDADSMRQRYPVLNKCIVLYPFCAIHRVFKGICFRKKTLAGAVDSAKEIVKQRDYYSRILQISGVL